MRFAPRQLIQIGTALHRRLNPASNLLGDVNRLANWGSVMLGAKHVRRVFCKFAFGFLQNLTNNSE